MPRDAPLDQPFEGRGITARGLDEQRRLVLGEDAAGGAQPVDNSGHAAL